MPESAEEIYARVVAQVGVDGRLPAPPVVEWETFPWEVEDGAIRARRLLPPVEAEEPRSGEGDRPCWRCQGDTSSDIWHNERWAVTSTPQPTGLPLVVFLQTREHLDFCDMDDDLAAELGRVTNWLHRIMGNLPNIGRVHVCKWGDGSSHLHVWFMARCERVPQVRGSFAAEWDDILPPTPEDVWRADLKYVADRLATHDGTALV